MDMITVTGTENLLMAAVLAKGTTVIKNAALEPEVIQLIDVLNSMGARIQGAGTHCLEIQGVDELAPAKATVIPDRIEAGTLMVAAAITRGDVWVENINPGHMKAFLDKLREAGVCVTQQQDKLRIQSTRRPVSVDIDTQPYPGFPTDMQAQMMAYMALADGTSVFRERIFENRFMHVSELKRMGAHIKLDGGQATVYGVKKLSGAPTMATDLRASASLVLAGLAASGRTEVSRIYHLDRGYQRLGKKLRTLGAKIRRVAAEQPVTIQ
jgi:UDP-N-acetylglucosamine 1-carboxyvinyltransferase